jgi:hypothetical protein
MRLDGTDPDIESGSTCLILEQTVVDAQHDAASERAVRAKEAGRLIASGHCDDARTYALDQGDFDLASRVVSFCAT